MIETHLNIFDCIVIGIMLLSCLIAFFRGFVKEVLSLGAWVGAAIVTFYLFPYAAAALRPYVKLEATIVTGIATLGVYISALICFSLINKLIVKFLKDGSDVGMLDNMLGFIFGSVRGAFIISLGFFLLSLALPDGEAAGQKEYPVWIQESMTHTYVEQGAIILARIAPEYLGRASVLQKKAVAQAKERIREREESLRDGEEGTGYSRESHREMDRLLDSTERE